MKNFVSVFDEGKDVCTHRLASSTYVVLFEC